MTGMEILTIASLVIGVATPCGSLVYFLGAVGQRLKNIENRQLDLAEDAALCEAARTKAEGDLHGRITATEKAVERIKGRLNGGFHEPEH